MTNHRAYNAIQWTSEMIQFLQDNYEKKTNWELAADLGLRITSVRMKLYSLGYKRMEMEYWTDEQVQFLKDNYKTIGDKELAKIFKSKWHKDKNWSHKHIEKKRRYLKLKRTEREKKEIHQRNVQNGCFKECSVKMWLKRGVSQEKEIRMWASKNGRIFAVIKINGKFIHWNRYRWEKQYGPIPNGMNVIYSDGNPYNRRLSNLQLVTNAELALINSRDSSQNLSDNYIAGILTHNQPELRPFILEDKKLIELKRTQLLLNRQIQQHEQN